MNEEFPQSETSAHVISPEERREVIVGWEDDYLKQQYEDLMLADETNGSREGGSHGSIADLEAKLADPNWYPDTQEGRGSKQLEQAILASMKQTRDFVQDEMKKRGLELLK
ncbi:MAG: hypothetical protein JWP09_633 [Candidatus Taylorbacteria bacterium]|nr:hypothetical protein [Candidatus Taylorbacteria bacterium]